MKKMTHVQPIDVSEGTFLLARKRKRNTSSSITKWPRLEGSRRSTPHRSLLSTGIYRKVDEGYARLNILDD